MPGKPQDNYQELGEIYDGDNDNERIDEPQAEDFAAQDDAEESEEYERAKAEEENEKLGWDAEEGGEAKEAREILGQRGEQKGIKPRKGEDVKADIAILVVIAVIFAVIIMLFNLALGG